MPSVLKLGYGFIVPASFVATAAALVIAAAPAPLTAQVAAGVAAAPVRLVPTTASAEARTAFTAGIDGFNNLFPARGTAELKRAIELDPAFGLARVIYGTSAVGLTTAERNAEIDRGMADAVKATPGELLVAMAYRESFRQNPVGARAILLTAGTLLPDEPTIAYRRAVLLGAVPGGTGTDAAVALRAVAERFPDYAPTYNTLAYAQWNSGARPAALATATTYMTKAPTIPNSHDTYAELLQWNGDFDGAVAHYKKAVEIDPTFINATYGLAEVYTLQGKSELARQTLTAALAGTTTPADRVAIHNRIANTYVLEGNTKAAMASLATVIEEATKAEMNGAIVTAHVALMNLEAAFGNPKTSTKAITDHIGHVAAVPPPTATATPVNPAGRYNGNGTVLAMAGQTAMARVYLDSLKQRELSNPSPQVTSQVHGLTGWVLYSEGKFTEALAEFRQSNQQIPTIRTGIALTQFKLGNVAEARSIRDEMVNDRNLNLANGGNVMARRILKVRIT